MAAKQRNRTLLIASLVLIGVFLTAVGVGRTLGIPLPSLDWPVGGHHLNSSKPVRLSISSLGVRADVVEVGRAGDGSIETPVEDPVHTVGWYRLGPAPGDPGTAVLVGHVDTAHQAAVFHNLHEIGTGRIIEITRENRRVATFRVDSVESFPKTAFPADRVLVHDDEPRLALVTCGGEWVGGETGYADNVIVFAHLV